MTYKEKRIRAKHRQSLLAVIGNWMIVLLLILMMIAVFCGVSNAQTVNYYGAEYEVKHDYKRAQDYFKVGEEVVSAQQFDGQFFPVFTRRNGTHFIIVNDRRIKI